ncbi:MAG: rRNA maturation RNase YbeY [Gammaproteobacteria bacterium GWF2_41_13]|nr:MAG: rRNA maturation RNase YbeY [Gammaproteobacteria bacterium GWF2_41_13]
MIHTNKTIAHRCSFLRAPTLNPESLSAIHIDIQITSKAKSIPSQKTLKKWIQTALTIHRIRSADIGIQIISTPKMAELNQHYRKNSGPTNVLTFIYEEGKNLAGDVVLCPLVIQQEAKQFNLRPIERFAHIVVHGCLHLMGFDHELNATEAERMEKAEIKVLKKLGYKNPYNEMP